MTLERPWFGVRGSEKIKTSIYPRSHASRGNAEADRFAVDNKVGRSMLRPNIKNNKVRHGVPCPYGKIQFVLLPAEKIRVTSVPN